MALFAGAYVQFVSLQNQAFAELHHLGSTSGSPDDDSNMIIGLIGIGVIIAIYFIPSIVAYQRQHHSAAAILVLNFFLGGTIIGWIIALIWSLTAVRPRA